MEPYLSQLGLDHRKYGVLAEHYPAVGRALLATLGRSRATPWTPGAEAAWAGAYERATQLMTAAAEKSAEHSPPWWSAEVVGHELRSPTLAVLTLRPDEPFPYLAGQYVSIQSGTGTACGGPSRWLTRRVPMACSPSTCGRCPAGG